MSYSNSVLTCKVQSQVTAKPTAAKPASPTMPTAAFALALLFEAAEVPVAAAELPVALALAEPTVSEATPCPEHSALKATSSDLGVISNLVTIEEDEENREEMGRKRRTVTNS